MNFRTFHITKREPFPPQAIGRSIDVHDRLFAECNPGDMIRLRMLQLYSMHDFVNGVYARLPECIYHGIGYIPEIVGTADPIGDVNRFAEPLV